MHLKDALGWSCYATSMLTTFSLLTAVGKMKLLWKPIVNQIYSKLPGLKPGLCFQIALRPGAVSLAIKNFSLNN